MSNSLQELGFDVVNLIISFLILVFILRLLLAMFSANGNNPITQSIIKISRPIRSIFIFLPNIGRFEVSSFIIIFLFHLAQTYMQTSDILLEKLVIFSFKSSIFSILDALVIIFIILAISSWFTQSFNHNRNPALDIVYEISNPILYSIKRVIPTSVGVIDFSVIIALVLIHFIKNFIDIIFINIIL